jgi:hypothetical protein
VPRKRAAPRTNFVPTIIDAIENPKLFARWFRDRASWRAWIVFLRAMFGLPMDGSDVELFRQCTARASAPLGGFSEAWLICGRRSGKSFILALIAVFLATFCDWRKYLSPGERGTIMVLAADRKQSRVIFRYIRALLTEVPALARLIERETADQIDLVGGVTVEVATANFRTTRGYTIVAALLDELAFWSSDELGSNPDTEIIAALRPGMATISGAILRCASSPYDKRGALWEAFRRHFGKEGPALVWHAPTRTMNPTISQDIIDEALLHDPAKAAAEYLAEFRSDVSGFIDRDVVEATIDRDVAVRPPLDGINYVASGDPSGGVGDSFTVGFAHAENGVAILDCLFERRAPFNPTAVVAEIADLLRSYRVPTIIGDHYSARWVTEAFAKEGITYQHSPRDRSAIYLDTLPLFTSGRARLLDNPRLVAQLVGLERRTSAGGRDRIDHGPHGHDDLCNVACGALVLAAQRPQEIPICIPYISSGREGLTSAHFDEFGRSASIFGIPGEHMHPDDWSPKW